MLGIYMFVYLKEEEELQIKMSLSLSYFKFKYYISSNIKSNSLLWTEKYYGSLLVRVKLSSNNSIIFNAIFSLKHLKII